MLVGGRDVWTGPLELRVRVVFRQRVMREKKAAVNSLNRLCDGLGMKQPRS
jgi:hypothetical protein